MFLLWNAVSWQNDLRDKKQQYTGSNVVCFSVDAVVASANLCKRFPEGATNFKTDNDFL